MSRSTNPLFLLNQVDPSLKSALGPYSKLGIEVSQFDGFFLIEMPLLGKVPLLNIDLSESQDFGDESSKDIMSLHDFDSDDTGARQVDLDFLANIIFRIVFMFNFPLLGKGIFFFCISESQVSSWFAFIMRNERLSFETVYTTVKLSWLQQLCILFLFFFSHLSCFRKTNQFHMPCRLLISLINSRLFKHSTSE